MTALLALAVGLPLGLSRPAAAEVVRFSLSVANNHGGTASAPLLFAEEDARRVDAVLDRLGGVPSANRHLVLDASRNRLLRAFANLHERVQAAEARGAETLVLFYYSGHADDARLQLGRTWITWQELRDLLERSGADVRLAFVDACKSGALTRLKGVQREQGFLIDLRERSQATGQVMVTSSAADEASQESEEIAGSYFTWAFLNALTGSADTNHDGRVTLTETWDYVHDETAFRTSSTRAGTQHPTYSWDLTGTGDVVLTDLGGDKASLQFPAGLRGRFALFDLDRRAFAAEVSVVDKAHRLSLPAGRYLVQQRHPTHLAVAEVSLAPGTSETLRIDGFASIEYEDDVAKGSIEQTVRRARRPDLELSVSALGRAYLQDTVQADYLPATGAMGLEARLVWRTGSYGSLDGNWGRTTTTVSAPGLPYAVPAAVSSGTFGLSAGHGTRPDRLLDIGGGVRLATVITQRSFADEVLPNQGLLTVAPGLAGRVGLRPGPVRLAVDTRLHYLPYRIDTRERGVAFTELLFSLGTRW